MIRNDPEHIKLRRCQNTLSVVGTGIILFAAWSVVKTVGSLMLGGSETMSQISENIQGSQLEITEEQLYLLTIFMMFIILAADLGIRLYVGLSAKAVASGKKKSSLHIVLTIVLICANIATILAAVYAVISKASKDYEELITVVIIELTSMIMMLEMVKASVTVRRMTGSDDPPIHMKE